MRVLILPFIFGLYLFSLTPVWATDCEELLNERARLLSVVRSARFKGRQVAQVSLPGGQVDFWDLGSGADSAIAFRKYMHFPGHELDLILDLDSSERDVGRFARHQKIVHVSDLPSPLKKVVPAIRERSKNDRPERVTLDNGKTVWIRRDARNFQEAAAFVVEFKSGESRSALFTSGLSGRVRWVDAKRALNGILAKVERSSIASIHFLHTHSRPLERPPNPLSDDTSFLPLSGADEICTGWFKEELRSRHGLSVPFQMYAVPFDPKLPIVFKLAEERLSGERGSEDSVFETYRDLISVVGKDLVSEDDLERMLASKNYFSLESGGSSRRDPLSEAFGRISALLSAKRLDTDLLRNKIEAFLNGELGGRRSAGAKKSGEQAHRSVVLEPYSAELPAKASHGIRKYEIQLFSKRGDAFAELSYEKSRRDRLEVVEFPKAGKGAVSVLWEGSVIEAFLSTDGRHMAILARDGGIIVLGDDFKLKPYRLSFDPKKLFRNMSSFSVDGADLYIWEKEYDDREETRFNIIRFDVESGDQVSSERVIVQAANLFASQDFRSRNFAASADGKKMVYSRLSEYGASSRLIFLDRTRSGGGAPMQVEGIHSRRSMSDGLAVDPKFESLVAYSEKEIASMLWTLGSQSRLFFHLQDSTFKDASFSPDSRYVVGREATVFDLSTGKRVLGENMEPASVSLFSFSRDMRLFARNQRAAIELYRVSDWTLVEVIPFSEDLSKISFSPDGERLLIQFEASGKRRIRSYFVSEFSKN